MCPTSNSTTHSRRWATDVRTIITLLVLVTFTSSAAAQDVDLPPPEQLEAPCVPELDTNRRAQLDHAGATGVWFHADLARCMLGRLELLPAYARHVRLLEERIQLADERDTLRTREVALATAEADAARTALEAAVRRAREAEADRDAWYRHPGLWAAVGAVVVIVLGVIGVWAVDQLRL